MKRLYISKKKSTAGAQLLALSKSSMSIVEQVLDKLCTELEK